MLCYISGEHTNNKSNVINSTLYGIPLSHEWNIKLNQFILGLPEWLELQKKTESTHDFAEAVKDDIDLERDPFLNLQLEAMSNLEEILELRIDIAYKVVKWIEEQRNKRLESDRKTN